MPVLLIGFKTSVAEATGAGLVVVWVAAIAGVISHARAGRLDVRVALTFGVPSVLGAVGGAQLHAEKVTVGLFALVLLTAVPAMFRKKPEAAAAPVATWAVVATGLAQVRMPVC